MIVLWKRNTKLAIKTLDEVSGIGEWFQEPGVIIASSLVGESEVPKLVGT